MSKLKKLFTLALVALGITAFAPIAQAEEKCTDCITFSADAPFGIKLKKGTHKDTPTVTLEYSTDQFNWKTFDVDTGYNAAQDGETYKLHIRGTDNKAFASEDFPVKGHSFTNTVGSAATAIACSGNALTLLDYATVAKGEKPTMNDYAFSNLFKGFAALTSAPALPATTLAQGCYKKMFSGCTSLTAAPALSATTLADYCYGSMFESCTSLTAAPELPATTLAETCYGSMFSGCTSLTSAPALSATTLADYCYYSMFFGCTALTAAPELPATTLAETCYGSMFSGCTSLTSAPALSATNLTLNCYASMFKDCTALTSAPALSATNLAETCYKRMFQGCTALVVNTNASGKAWSIPSDAKEGQDWNLNMFAGTSGNIADAPTSGMPKIGTTYYVVEPVKIPYEKPEAVDNAEYKVYVGGVEVTDGMVWSNRTDNVASPADPVATVVYTAKPGYAFEDGTTEKSVAFDTRVSPAVLTGDAPAPAGKSELQLGVVAQRYPWNGVVDVEYKAAYWSDAVFGAVEIKCDDVVVTNALNIFKSGTGVQPVDLKALFGEKAGNAQFKAVVSDQPAAE